LPYILNGILYIIYFDPTEEIAKQVKDSESSVIVTIPQLIPTVEKVKEKCPTLKSIIVVGDAEGNHSFFDMLNTDTSSGKLLKGTDINTMRETAVLPYSSGTTVNNKAAFKE
jgi:4-coumarate--CoA ligase